MCYCILKEANCYKRADCWSKDAQNMFQDKCASFLCEKNCYTDVPCVTSCVTSSSNHLKPFNL